MFKKDSGRKNWKEDTNLNFSVFNLWKGDARGRSFYCVDLRSLACWDCGFESSRGHGFLSLVSVVCYHVKVSASGWSFARGSPTACGVSECDREVLTVRRSGPTRGCRAVKKKMSILSDSESYAVQYARTDYKSASYTLHGSVRNLIDKYHVNVFVYFGLLFR